MAHFAIFSSDANLVEAFDRADEAREALAQIAQADPEAADEYALLEYDDAGHPVGEVLVASELLGDHTTA